MSAVQDLNNDKEHPSPRLVMTTLVIVSLPVEIIFLTAVHFLVWIHLPFIFIVLQVLFFLIAVSYLPFPPHEQLAHSLPRSPSLSQSHDIRRHSYGSGT